MPALPVLPGAAVVRALERAGFEVVRVSGSHHRMAHPDGRRRTVPVHRADMKRGALRHVLRDCELTVDEFLVLVER
jgi:predicted RNA binding protein YcfA (HicA-like mRNA interferase family)